MPRFVRVFRFIGRSSRQVRRPAASDPIPRATSPSRAPSRTLRGARSALRIRLELRRPYESRIDTNGEARAPLELVLRVGGVEVAGIVEDRTGGPIPGASVSASEIGGTKTDEAGRFTLWAKEGVRLFVWARAPGYAPSGLRVTSPAPHLKITLTPESTVEGSVLDGESRERVGGVLITAEGPLNILSGVGSSARGSATYPAQARSGQNGTFTLRGLEPGTYLVTAKSDTHELPNPMKLSIGLVERRTGVTLEMQKRASETETTVAQEGVRVAGRVTLLPDDRPCPKGHAWLERYRKGRTFVLHPEGPPADRPGRPGRVHGRPAGDVRGPRRLR